MPGDNKINKDDVARIQRANADKDTSKGSYVARLQSNADRNANQQAGGGAARTGGNQAGAGGQQGGNK
ncbi:hypothetical protein DL770_007277 [Monosporascus sp. CRB-9-2]|nr:hypothetical protein DL770_007277 [Monosporascus sp. CRB-9-2]